MKTYYVDAAPVLVERAWSEFRKTPSLPGDRWPEVRFEAMAGEPERTRLQVALDDGGAPAEIDGAMRRFRDFLDELVLGGAKDIPTLADPAVPGRRTPHE